MYNEKEMIRVSEIYENKMLQMKQNAIGQPLLRGPHLSFLFGGPSLRPGRGVGLCPLRD